MDAFSGLSHRSVLIPNLVPSRRQISKHAGFLDRSRLETGPKRAATHAAAATRFFTINIYSMFLRRSDDGRGVSAPIKSKAPQASTPTSDDSDRKKPPR